MAQVEFRAAGDSALMLYVKAETEAEDSAYVRAVLRALDDAPPSGLLDAIPSRAALLLLYDPLQTTDQELKGHVSGLAATTEIPRAEPALTEIPVLYGGEAGVDLGRVAESAGLTEQDAVELHSSAEYTVHFLGFMPGFPYMGGLPELLHTPRLRTPRTLVPAGSVAIAEHQTAIYPSASPGGWNLIGRTPYKLFDPQKSPPALLEPGDKVRFVPVDEAEYSRLHFEALAGRL